MEVYIRTDGRICYGSLHIPDREVMIALRGVGSPSVNGLGFKIKRRLKGECFDYYGLFERQQETLYFKQFFGACFSHNQSHFCVRELLVRFEIS